ncbi:MAG: hypothetical protein H8E35_12160 [Ardenticatenia bacterium]|nr:hypothetical protein [Ardenticatenia bacterium]MBL7066023.1 hypothetical protein [Anaerolineae bacterium]
MSEKLLGQMNGEEFEALVDKFIESQGKDIPLPGETFFEMWADVEDTGRPIDIQGMIVDDRLVFLPPARADVSLIVRENEIAVGGSVIRVHLVPARA